MKLAPKLTLTLTVCAAGIWTAADIERHGRERNALSSDMLRDHHDLGAVIAAAAAREPQTEMGGLVALLAPRREGLRVRVVPQTVVRAQSTAELTVTYADLPGALLEITESNAARDRFLSMSRAESGVALAVLVALFATVSHLLGEALIARRTRAIVKRTRKIAEGDLEHAEPVEKQGDELTEIAAGIEEMRVRLRGQTEARIRAVEQLRHADRLSTVGKLAAGLAHELGTPLNVVMGRAGLAARAKELPEAARHVGAIGEAAQRMSQLLQQLMSFARRGEPKLTRQDVAAIVASAAGFVETLARKHGVTVNIDAADALYASVDPVQLEQVFVNLLVNAFHASPRGAAVHISIVQKGDRVVIDVLDKGSGIAARDLPYVFDPFYTTKDVGEGTGLGLSVVRGIVEEHGGSIELSSTEGSGTLARIEFPLARELV